MGHNTNLRKKKIAIIGSNGLPASYGGFETLTDNLIKELNEKHDFFVYCKKTPKSKQLKFYNNARLVYMPFKANGMQSVIYDIFSIFHAWWTCDEILILGPNAAGFILLFNKIFKKKIIVNHGGLNEWEREKYSYLLKKYSKINHKIASKCADYNVTDNNLLKLSIKKLSNQNSYVIRYGGDHVQKIKVTNPYLKKYPFLAERYAVSVSRAQPDNKLHVVLKAFESINNIKLVLISNWQVSKYGLDLKKKYLNYPGIILLDAIYDATELNLIRSNAQIYIHSHSQCGTAPSLVEAISLELPIFSISRNII